MGRRPLDVVARWAANDGGSSSRNGDVVAEVSHGGAVGRGVLVTLADFAGGGVGLLRVEMSGRRGWRRVALTRGGLLRCQRQAEVCTIAGCRHWAEGGVGVVAVAASAGAVASSVKAGCGGARGCSSL